MPFRLALSIALRHLQRRKRQTVLATLGVLVGGSIFALMIGITMGQRRYLRAKLVEVSPHIIITSDLLEPVTARNLIQSDTSIVELTAHTPPTNRRELKPYTEVMDKALRASPLIAAVAPYVVVRGVMRNGTRDRAVTARGIQPQREKYIAQLAQNIRRGTLDGLLADPNGVIIGRGLARKLAVDVGGDVSFIGPSGAIERMKVVAVFESGVAEFDDKRAYINIGIAQSLRQIGSGSVTGLSVQVKDADRVDEVKQALQRATGYQVDTWEESNKQILDFQGRQQMITRLLVIFVFITAAFGISNTMVAIVLQKKHDIAVMKSFGVSGGGVVMIFLLEGIIIGLIGGALAAAAGYGIATLFSNLSLFPQNNPSAFLRFEKFPVARDYGIYLLTFGLSLLLSVIASTLPARRAARFIPVQVIRGEV